MVDWPVGISTGCFHQQPITSCLEPIRDAGFSILELCSLTSHFDYRDRAVCREVAMRLDDLGAEAYSFHGPFAEVIDITALDAAQRQGAVDELCRAADAAATVGVRYLVIHPGPERSGLPRGERLDRMEHAARALEEVAGHCRSLGLGLVLENMLPHLFTGHVRELLWLLGALSRTDVGLCLDTGHASLSGDLRTVAHKLRGHLLMLHASDNRGQFDDHLPPGEGLIAWPELLEQLAQAHFSGTLILELAAGGEAQPLLRRAQRARRYLRGLGRGLPGHRPM